MLEDKRDRFPDIRQSLLTCTSLSNRPWNFRTVSGVPSVVLSTMAVNSFRMAQSGIPIRLPSCYALSMRLLASALTATLALAAAPTFHRDVLPILQKHCQGCHRPGEIGPMPRLRTHRYDPSRRRYARRFA